MTIWQAIETDANIDLMERALHLPKSLCKTLASRGVRDKNNAIKYLYPKIEYMHDTKELKNIEAAMDRLILALANEENITIYGDYDVDGIMSTVILSKALAYLDGNISYTLPHRQQDGYGLNMEMVDKLHEEGTRLLITVDNGIAAHEEIKKAISLGMDVIVLDHHEPQGDKELLGIIINPKQKDCPYPFKELSAGGLSYKFVTELFKKLDKPLPIADELLIFAAIATVCDVVPLLDENRIIVAEGLARLHRQPPENMGLLALLKVLELQDSPISTFDLGFRIGPTINATGRLAHGSMAVELLLSQNHQEVNELAKEMLELNEERQAITEKATREAKEYLQEKVSQQQQDIIKVIYLPTVHESVAGIVAGRIKEDINQPIIVLTDGINGVKGSGRSASPYDMFLGLEKQADLLLQFGGHEMAAGLSIEKDNIDLLRSRLNQEITYTLDDFVRRLFYEDELALPKVNIKLAKQISLLAPFGKGNEKPLFKFSKLLVVETKILGKNKNTVKWKLEGQGVSIDAIAFNQIDALEAYFKQNIGEDSWRNLFQTGIIHANYTIDILGGVEINFFRNTQQLQIHVADFM